ncbi:serine/threonine protein kinase [Aspergillus taichungensis]|uniref:Serine/threonine protein kinase n=1 Tax=Aspergillus taichungensis TaxID=482145 RepID=A0A2J5HEH8_9EURO|nr:serine/threonine protein kinase [Aspergillus taichungensis]
MDPSKIRIIREITSSDASSIFEVELDGQEYAFKLFHDNGDPGYTPNSRDLNRFRCELNAYQKLHTSGVCARGFVPIYHGSIDRIDPAAFHPALQHFAQDKLNPSAILLEYFPHAESLNCVNYSDALYPQVIEGTLVWIDFDVATTFTDCDPEQLARCDYELALVKGFAEALMHDQVQGLPPNTKFY